MSGRIHKDLVPKVAYMSLAPEVKFAIIAAKNMKKGISTLTEWGNSRGGPEDGPPLPKLSAGCLYREKDVGQARPEDPKGERGTRRLVFEVHKTAGIMETYYTEEHYAKGSFVRIV